MRRFDPAEHELVISRTSTEYCPNENCTNTNWNLFQANYTVEIANRASSTRPSTYQYTAKNPSLLWFKSSFGFMLASIVFAVAALISLNAMQGSDRQQATAGKVAAGFAIVSLVSLMAGIAIYTIANARIKHLAKQEAINQFENSTRVSAIPPLLRQDTTHESFDVADLPPLPQP